MSILNNLINGISLGSVYAIIALGYTMVYGIAKMLNFAHGDVIMVGAYICFFTMSGLSGSFEEGSLAGAVVPALAGVLLAMVVCTVLGMVIERLAYKPLRQAPSLAVLITAIGVSYFLQNSALLLWTSNPKSFSSVVGTGSIKLLDGQLTITHVALVTVAACIVIMLGLTWFTGHTRMGRAMRACSEDKAAAQLMGINVNSTISMTFAIGSALAAIAGVLLCSTYPSIKLLDGQLTITHVALVTVAACIVIMLGLTWFTGHTRMGRAMRACSEDKAAAQLMGINVNSTISMTFAIGSALAAIAGVLLCSTYPSLMPTTGALPGIKAFTAAVFGGIGSIPGAMLGGILLGIIEIFAKAFNTNISDAVVFAVLIVVLLVKPSGLLGKYVPEKV